MSNHHHGTPVGQPGDFRKRLALAFAITSLIVVAQAVGAWITGSLALLTDTAHALNDATGLLDALIAGSLLLKTISSHRWCGFICFEVIEELGREALFLIWG